MPGAGRQLPGAYPQGTIPPTFTSVEKKALARQAHIARDHATGITGYAAFEALTLPEDKAIAALPAEVMVMQRTAKDGSLLMSVQPAHRREDLHHAPAKHRVGENADTERNQYGGGGDVPTRAAGGVRGEQIREMVFILVLIQPRGRSTSRMEVLLRK